MYGIRVCVLRLTNTYGPRMRVRDARQTFLGYWLRQIAARRGAARLRRRAQRRDFNYVDDAVRALLLAGGARRGGRRRSTTSATTRCVVLLELAELLVDA